MSDGEFGATLVGRPIPDPVKPGDKVRIIGGRYRKALGTLDAFVDVPTPGGSLVKVARVIRPRAGLTLVFSHEIERA